MPYTVPNQRIVKVHREKVLSDFLGIQNENWQAAARDLGAHALLLYLYFAANADNYTLALSPAAIRQAIGMPPQTYRDQFNKLIDKGYIVNTKGNMYSFYEKPQNKEEKLCTDNITSQTNNGLDDTENVQNSPTDDIEINNINIKDKINKGLMVKQVSPTLQGNRKEFVF